MDFDLSEEQRMIQDMAYKFAVNEMAPRAKEYDREEKYAREVWQKAAEAGLVGAVIPEQYGGPGFGFFEQALIMEQLCRVDLGLCLCTTSSFGSEHILFFGTEEQKEKYLPPLVLILTHNRGCWTPEVFEDVGRRREP
ncbi:MAG: acyl-CoA dehydrogenase family protein [Desulfomonilaceae bacterium]